MEITLERAIKILKTQRDLCHPINIDVIQAYDIAIKELEYRLEFTLQVMKMFRY